MSLNPANTGRYTPKRRLRELSEDQEEAQEEARADGAGPPDERIR